MAILPSVTETQLFTQLRAYLLTIVDCEVVRGQVNRVAMPKGDVIYMSPGSMAQLATDVNSFTDTTQSIEQSTQWVAQIDCYGSMANDRAKVITMLLRNGHAFDFFKASGVDMSPLYADDAQQMPLVTGEEQYLERWMFNAVFQYNPVITLNQQSANQLEVGLINVDVSYPP